MNTQQPTHEQQDPNLGPGDRPLVLPLDALDAGMLLLVGGKAANLGELARAGLPVPEGFCLTTTAYELVANNAGLDPVLDELAAADARDAAHLERCAAAARAALLAAPVPTAVQEAVREAYEHLSQGGPLPVAVRSSATAEDLSFASFAGQQDTYLNVVGLGPLLDAVRRCWASLWTDRAVSYRATNGIDQRTVRLAVVVQRMVDAQVAGVLFTANPLTGRRHQAVIDASPGLGEAVVSGAVTPDHFVADPATGAVLERRLGDKRLAVRSLPGGGTERVELAEQSAVSSLTDEQILALANLGALVEAHYDAPQDIEWAIDPEGRIWLTQARPITTLYPLPDNAPTGEDNLRAYFSINVAQGVNRPFTPMGIATFRLMIGSGATLAGFPPRDPLAGPPFLVVAARRLFADMTPLVRSVVGREILSSIMPQMEARSGVLFQQLATDPRLALVHTPRRVVLRRLLTLFPRIRRAPLYALQSLLSPRAARRRMSRLERRLRTLGAMPPSATSYDRLAAFERLLLDNTASMVVKVIPIIALVFGLPALLARLLGDLATADERQAVLRAVPHNPTTEMNLALWKLASRLRDDPAVASLFRDLPPEQLARKYREGALPPLLLQGLAGFLRVYGHRGVAEIDLGLPRWSEDPTHVFGVLANYLQLKDPASAPDVQFRRGARDARTMAAELTRRASQRGWLRGKLVAFCLSRLRGLTGLREVPKFNLVLLMSRGRQLLMPVAEELVREGRLEAPEDIFFMDTSEAREALAGKDFRAIVHERRADYNQELARRHIPRVLLSDGTEPEAEARATPAASGDGALKGTPASAGLVTGKARVILDPVGARLEPGEILVAPSTDPGWTPLFLTAGGLVMEMGGPMSHGAVVAREYGIPAVVGLPGATEHIASGQQITVDGSSGLVTFA